MRVRSREPGQPSSTLPTERRPCEGSAQALRPWIAGHKKQRLDLDDFPNVKAWFERISARPAVERAYERASEIREPTAVTEESKKVLFGEDERTQRGEGRA